MLQRLRRYGRRSSEFLWNILCWTVDLPEPTATIFRPLIIFNTRISFPHYLFFSLKNSIEDHRKIPRKNPVLHSGLIRLIHEHFKNVSTLSNPLTASASKGYDTVNSSSEDKDVCDSEWEEEDPPSRKNIKRKTPLRKPLSKKASLVKTPISTS